jgi:hypothetical protein
MVRIPSRSLAVSRWISPRHSASDRETNSTIPDPDSSNHPVIHEALVKIILKRDDDFARKRERADITQG